MTSTQARAGTRLAYSATDFQLTYVADRWWKTVDRRRLLCWHKWGTERRIGTVRLQPFVVVLAPCELLERTCIRCGTVQQRAGDFAWFG